MRENLLGVLFVPGSFKRLFHSSHPPFKIFRVYVSTQPPHDLHITSVFAMTVCNVLVPNFIPSESPKTSLAMRDLTMQVLMPDIIHEVLHHLSFDQHLAFQQVCRRFCAVSRRHPNYTRFYLTPAAFENDLLKTFESFLCNRATGQSKSKLLVTIGTPYPVNSTFSASYHFQILWHRKGNSEKSLFAIKTRTYTVLPLHGDPPLLRHLFPRSAYGAELPRVETFSGDIYNVWLKPACTPFHLWFPRDVPRLDLPSFDDIRHRQISRVDRFENGLRAGQCIAISQESSDLPSPTTKHYQIIHGQREQCLVQVQAADRWVQMPVRLCSFKRDESYGEFGYSIEGTSAWKYVKYLLTEASTCERMVNEEENGTLIMAGEGEDESKGFFPLDWLWSGFGV